MQTSRPSLVVSIHDVSPLTAGRVREMLKDLGDIGLKRTSLLVIPNHHHKAPVGSDQGFSQWISEITPDPHEIVLHGYYHLRPPKPTSWLKTLITERYTAGEGEFFDLSQEEAAERLGRAGEEFGRFGWKPSGFIAPAWLLGDDAEAAVKAAGFEYTTRLGTVKDLATGRETASQSLVWSVRSGWRRAVSLKWNAYLNHQLRDNPLLRVGLHPPDWDHPEIRRQILDLISAALARREAITYEEWQRGTLSPA